MHVDCVRACMHDHYCKLTKCCGFRSSIAIANTCSSIPGCITINFYDSWNHLSQMSNVLSTLWNIHHGPQILDSIDQISPDVFLQNYKKHCME